MYERVPGWPIEKNVDNFRQKQFLMGFSNCASAPVTRAASAEGRKWDLSPTLH